MAKRKKKGAETPAPLSAEREQHDVFVEVETSRAGVVLSRNVTADPIARYHHRGHISWKQYSAADNFAGKFRQANLAAVYAKMRFNDDPKGMPQTAQEAIEKAKIHVNRALEFVGFPLANVLVHVVGHCENAGSWDGVRYSKRKQQEGMTALRLALDGLAKYYRL